MEFTNKTNSLVLPTSLFPIDEPVLFSTPEQPANSSRLCLGDTAQYHYDNLRIVEKFDVDEPTTYVAFLNAEDVYQATVGFLTHNVLNALEIEEVAYIELPPGYACRSASKQCAVLRLLLAQNIHYSSSFSFSPLPLQTTRPGFSPRRWTFQSFRLFACGQHSTTMCRTRQFSTIRTTLRHFH
jgi:hypothetical protein